MQDEKKSSYDRWVDLASVLLISAATVLSAWCGYEAARWTGLQTREYNEANANRVAASVETSRAETLKIIDVAMFLRYTATIAEHQTDETVFLYHRFRPEMKRAVDAWLATRPLKNHRAPASPFEMPQYRVAADLAARHLNDRASETFRSAQGSNELADEYVRFTVIFAGVLFLAGMSTKLRFPFHVIVIVGGALMLLFGLTRLFGLPIR